MEQRVVRIPWLLLALGGCLALVGCAAGVHSAATARRVRAIDPAELQVELMDFADSYVTEMADTYDQLAADAPTTDGRRLAFEGKVSTARGAFINACNPNPVAGLLDMLVLVTL